MDLVAIIAAGTESRATDTRIPLAILGDSDSHSYHDELSFLLAGRIEVVPIGRRPGNGARSCRNCEGEQIDLGPWGSWGTRRIVARAQKPSVWTGATPQRWFPP